MKTILNVVVILTLISSSLAIAGGGGGTGGAPMAGESAKSKRYVCQAWCMVDFSLQELHHISSYTTTIRNSHREVAGYQLETFGSTRSAAFEKLDDRCSDSGRLAKQIDSDFGLDGYNYIRSHTYFSLQLANRDPRNADAELSANEINSCATNEGSRRAGIDVPQDILGSLENKSDNSEDRSAAPGTKGGHDPMAALQSHSSHSSSSVAN